MKLYVLIFSFLFMFTAAHSQTWDGGGGDNDWNNALNWDNDQVPLTGDIVTINSNTLVEGTVSNNPARIIIGANKTVNLNINVTITSTTEHCITSSNNAVLTFIGGTVNMNPPSSKNGIATFNSTLNPYVNLQAGAVINITGGSNALNLASPTGTFINGGDINVDGSNNGIRLTGGSFSNSGNISTINCASDGIYSEATFTNTVDGIITSNNAVDDCIEAALGTFTNNGTINFLCLPTAGTNNNGIAIGTSTTSATFSNTSNNSINGDGGTGTMVRPMYVYEMGELNNTGTINLEGGNTGAILYNRGQTVNEAGATMDLGVDGRINVNQGTFINDGLITTDRGSAGVIANATATNNGFYDYGVVSTFSIGTGTIADNGIDLLDSNDTDIDAGGTDTVKIANTSYTFIYNGEVLGTSNADGKLGIPDGVLLSDPAVISIQEFDGLNFSIQNFDALLPIELVDFEVRKINNDVHVNWKTASEMNVNYVAVERSQDGKTFRELHKELSNGNSFDLNTYNFVDTNPTKGLSYYRLKSVDLNGYTEYSDVRSVFTRSENSMDEISVYPTVANNGVISVNLSAMDTDNFSLKIYNATGQQMINKTLQGGSEHSINVAELPQGLYYFNIANNNESTTGKLIVN